MHALLNRKLDFYLPKYVLRQYKTSDTKKTIEKSTNIKMKSIEISRWKSTNRWVNKSANPHCCFKAPVSRRPSIADGWPKLGSGRRKTSTQIEVKSMSCRMLGVLVSIFNVFIHLGLYLLFWVRCMERGHFKSKINVNACVCFMLCNYFALFFLFCF